MTTLLQSWESVKDRVHDISGIENPINWLFENKGGIFYPVKEVTDVEDTDDLFDKLDPDMTDEELEELGYVVKYSVLIGDDGEVNFRENCGHAVTTF